jgi:hypothetical protein
MRSQSNSESFLFTIGEGGQGEPTTQRWAFFGVRNIYSYLMKLQQGFIDNNYSGHRKVMRYFI